MNNDVLLKIPNCTGDGFFYTKEGRIQKILELYDKYKDILSIFACDSPSDLDLDDRFISIPGYRICESSNGFHLYESLDPVDYPEDLDEQKIKEFINEFKEEPMLIYKLLEI
jgi:hypothetical protein